MLATKDPDYLDTALAYQNAGLCALKSKNFQMAIGFFEKALDQDPTFCSATFCLAQLAYSSGNYQEAKAYLKRPVLMQHPSPESLALGVQIGIKLGDKQLIRENKKQLFALFPHSSEAHHALLDAKS